MDFAGPAACSLGLPVPVASSSCSCLSSSGTAACASADHTRNSDTSEHTWHCTRRTAAAYTCVQIRLQRWYCRSCGRCYFSLASCSKHHDGPQLIFHSSRAVHRQQVQQVAQLLKDNCFQFMLDREQSSSGRGGRGSGWQGHRGSNTECDML